MPRLNTIHTLVALIPALKTKHGRPKLGSTFCATNPVSSKPYLRCSCCHLIVQDDDSYGEDEFDRSEGGGGGRNSPGRERGGGGGEFGGGRVPCEASEWPMSKRIKGLKTLKRLSKANRCV